MADLDASSVSVVVDLVVLDASSALQDPLLVMALFVAGPNHRQCAGNGRRELVKQTTVSSSSGLIAVIAVVVVPISPKTTVSSSSGLIALVVVPISSRLLSVSPMLMMMMLMSHPIDVVVVVVAVVLQSPCHPPALFDCRLEVL